MAAFTYTKPTVGGSEDTWGTTLNANWDALGTFLGALDSTELAVLDGITATTAELNILDGVTATTAELNSLDGISSNGSTLIAAASFNVMRDLLAIGGISGNGAGIEIGSDETGNRSSFLDLHASDGVGFSARILRDPGVNGEMDIIQTGSGALNLNTSGGAVRTNQTPAASDNSGKIATTAFVQAAIALKAIGEAQTWQGVGRSANVWYQNTSTRPIVFQMISNATGNLHIDVGPSTASYGSQTWGDLSSGTYDAASTIVPSGHFYRARGSGMAINVAAELR